MASMTSKRPTRRRTFVTAACPADSSRRPPSDHHGWIPAASLRQPTQRTARVNADRPTPWRYWHRDRAARPSPDRRRRPARRGRGLAVDAVPRPAPLRRVRRGGRDGGAAAVEPALPPVLRPPAG